MKRFRAVLGVLDDQSHLAPPHLPHLLEVEKIHVLNAHLNIIMLCLIFFIFYSWMTNGGIFMSHLLW